MVRLPLRSPAIATFMLRRLFFFERSVKQIAQCLRRMFVAAVAAIDHRDRRILGSEPRGAVARMANDDDIGVVGDDANRIGEAFALGGGADRRIGAGNIGAAEPQHRGLERQPRARRGFVEQARQNGLRGESGAACDPVGDMGVGEFLQKPLRDLEDRLDLLVAEIVDRNDMARGRLGLGHQSAAIGPIRAPRQARIGGRTRRCTENIDCGGSC